MRYHQQAFFQEHKIHFTLSLEGGLASPAYEKESDDLVQ